MDQLNWTRDPSPWVARSVEKAVAPAKDTKQAGVDTWTRVRALLDRALMPHPEARAAVLRAFEEELERAG